MLLPGQHHLSRLLPQPLQFAHVLRHEKALPAQILRQLAGNSMHIAQVGLSVAFALLMTRDVREEAEPKAAQRRAKRRKTESLPAQSSEPVMALLMRRSNPLPSNGG